MGISKMQRDRVEAICHCGCGQKFTPFPVYGKKGEGLRCPIYRVGHSPGCKTSKPAWNKGLTKADHPSISRMGYQPGHAPHNNWSKVNEALKNDPVIRARWIKSKKGQVAWNKGIKKSEYENGIASGQNHGNWKGGKRGVRDTAEYAQFRMQIYERDKYTCQNCGDHNHEGRGSRIRLEVHHIIAIKEDHTISLSPNNVITLCAACHRLTDNYGTKLVHKRRNQSGNSFTVFSNS